ncbi:hypothetical protein TIFTF001_039033 [Ficus carica]|uniref:Uncharacterized protein n=1 Tax=Ficus carica TaxID=3494 RepID=A0AA88E8T0_FICCA|nr:hypothetical protein TIFTF001_039033 [Ficus carica]
MSTEGLMAELQKVMHEAKEGSDIIEVMILDAFEKATIKARYDLLKEYKQGLFIEAEIDEVIELYEDEAGYSSSAPADEITPASNDHGPSGDEPFAEEIMLASNGQGPSKDEPPVDANPSEDRETRE